MEGAAAQHRPDHRGDCLRFGEARRLNFRISAEPVGSVSEGKRSADGASITGTWAGTEPDFLGTQGRPLPLRLERHEADSVVPRVRNYTAGENYASDRLGDDVLAVIDALKLSRPVLAGHSLAGEELSSVGSRHPEKVAGLIYLEAAYQWAYYDQAHGDLIVDRNEVQRKLEQLQPGRQPQLPGALVSDLLEMLPALERDLRAEQEQLAGTQAATAQPKAETPTIGFALQMGMQKYTAIPCPILAIYAGPRDRGIADPAKAAAADAKDLEPITAFEKGVPSGRVVRLAHAKHFIFESNEADVLREMRSFIAGLN